MAKKDARSEALTPLQMTLLIAIGVVALSGVFLQPLLLGDLLSHGRLSSEGLGRASTGELLALGLGSMAAGAYLKPIRLRRTGVLAAIALLAVNALTMASSGWGVVGVRTLAGLLEGVLMWLPISAIAQAVAAGRLTAIFTTASAAVPAILASMLPLLIGSTQRPGAGYMVIALLAGLAALLARWIPDAITPYSSGAETAAAGKLNARAYATLAIGFMLTAASAAEWAYLAPISIEAGHPPSTLALAVSLGLGAQVCAGLAAAALTERLPLLATLIGSCIAIAVGLIIIYGLPSAWLFVVAVTANAFFAQFLLPFEFLLAIRMDPDRQAALFLTGAQMIGASSGPLLGSFLVSAQSSRGAIVGAGAPLLIGLALTATLAFRQALAGRTARRAAGREALGRMEI